MDALSKPKTLLFHVGTQQEWMCQFLIILLLASGFFASGFFYLTQDIWGFFLFLGYKPMSSRIEHNLCEVSATPRLSWCLWDKGIIRWGDAAGRLRPPLCMQVLYRCYTRNTKEWLSWQKQLNSLKIFTMGSLQEGLNQKSSQVNRALHFASARIRAGIRVSSWSPIHSRCLVLGWYGGSPGFSLQGRGKEHYKPKHPLSGTSCSQLSALPESGNESVHFGSINSRLG